MVFAIIILLIIVLITLGSGILRSLHKKKLFRLQHLKRIDKINALVPDVVEAFADISYYFNFNHYITESERKDLEVKYANLYKEVSNIITAAELEESAHKECIKRFHKAMSSTSVHKRINNDRFLQNQLSEYAQYFDSILAYPLDSQQREAIVSLEDNVLVISSAGSGKTMTTVGKVRYLIDIQHVPAEKILLITFTRKAAESLSDRLGEKNLKCRTFHKLALDIISEATGEKPTITSQDFSVQVYHKLFQDSYSFRQAIADHIIRARYKMKDQFEYSSRREYMEDRRKHGIQSYYKDMDGKPVFCKSDEESQICDFLGSRGLKFRYEEKYEVDTVEADYRQYCPDFSIYIDLPDGGIKRVYLEHFAVNEYNRCPSFFSAEEESNYKQSIIWKRQLHFQH